jgi:hypothetical protein
LKTPATPTPLASGLCDSFSVTSLLRELDHRKTDGIDVWLLWSEDDGTVTVSVADDKTGDRFTIEVRDDERPMDVFHHPYAYAAWHGIDTRAEARPVSFVEPISG